MNILRLTIEADISIDMMMCLDKIAGLLMEMLI